MRKTDRIDELIKQINIPAGPELDSRIDVLLQQSDSRPLNTWSLIMNNSLTKFAAAALIIAAALAGLYKVTGSVDGASVAWAQVVEQLNKYERYKCRQRVVRDDGTKSPDRNVYHMNLSLRREESEDGSVYIIDMQHRDAVTVELYPDKKKAVVTKLLNFGPRNDPDIIDMVKRFEQVSTESLGTKEVDGKTLTGFHHKLNEHNDFTVWVDSGTKLPSEIELKHPSAGQTIYMDRFEFDFDLPASAFSTDIPDGYKVKTIVQDHGGTVAPKPKEISADDIRGKFNHPAYKLENIPWAQEIKHWEMIDPLGTKINVYLTGIRTDNDNTLILIQAEYYELERMTWIPQQQMVLETPRGAKLYTHPNSTAYAQHFFRSLSQAAPDFISADAISPQIYTREIVMPDGTVLGFVANHPLPDARLQQLADSLLKIEPAD